ncbi:eIF-2-alpha kinase activator gcn1, partial [Lachnellula suecica]
MDVASTLTILAFVLLKTWQCLEDTPAAQKNVYYAKLFPSLAVLEEIASSVSLTFAPGLFDILQASTPPTIAVLKTLTTETMRCWAIYIIILEKPYCTPKIYIGSATEAIRGLKNRFTQYDSRLMLPRHVDDAIKDGYKIVHKAPLCWIDIPAASLVPIIRVLFLALEATFAYMLWAMRTVSRDFGMSHMCLWDRTTLEYEGLCSHCCLIEKIIGDFELSSEQLEAADAERKKIRDAKAAEVSLNWHHKQMETNYDAYAEKNRQRQADLRERSPERIRDRGRAQTQRYYDEEKHYCKTCKVNCASSTALKIHNLTPSHLSVEERMNRPFTCIPCVFGAVRKDSLTELDDVQDGAQEAGASLLEVLGEEKRNRVLSLLYICRCDTSGLVRTAAVDVWKPLVASQRTLKELIPTLTKLIISRLASSNPEQKVIAGNALGELIRKAGDSVLSTLLPTLEEGLQTSTDTDTKQGICIALRELISSASPEALEDHEKTLISVVRTALIDSDEDVRETAAEAFDSLQQMFGKKAVDQVLPYLLSLLRTEGEADNALSALLTLLTETTRSNIILPNLLPTLTTVPISSFNAKALASLSTVAGSAITRRLPVILTSLMDSIVSCKNEELKADLETSFDTVILSIDEFDGLNTAMSVLLALVKHEDHRRRAATDYHLAKFFAAASVDYSRYNQDIIRALLMSFDDRDPEVVKAAWTALSEFTKHLKKEEMESLVFSTRQILQHVGMAGSNLAGFGLPKGINAILPIFLQGLMNGTSEQRTQSALAISDIIDRTSGDSLKPFVTQITGPLIRVVSERSTEVKAAILLTLNNLLEKIPAFLKPFLPQLQRTFAKSLADTSSEVLRSRAAKALGTLITLTPRIDPLIAELVTGSRTSDVGVRNAMLKALYEVISKAGANMGEPSRNAVLALIDTDPEDNDISMAITNAKLLGALIKNLPSENAAGLIKNRVMTTHFSQPSVLALNAVLSESASSLTKSAFANDLPKVICQGMGSKNPFISDNCVLAAGKYLLADTRSSDYETTKPLFESLATLIAPGNPADTRRLSLVVVRTVCRHHMDLVRPHLPILAPPIFASVRDMVIPIKLAAEAAFMALFDVVDEEGRVFDKYIASADLPAGPKHSMQDYFKRVALRLGNTARERKEAE